MSDLRDLYQELIVDHNKNPRNYGVLADANRRAEGYNPLCGDKVTVYLHVDGDRIGDVRFEGAGCAISTASASLMTTYVKGKTRLEVEALFGPSTQWLRARTRAMTPPIGSASWPCWPACASTRRA